MFGKKEKWEEINNKRENKKLGCLVWEKKIKIKWNWREEKKYMLPTKNLYPQVEEKT